MKNYGIIPHYRYGKSSTSAKAHIDHRTKDRLSGKIIYTSDAGEVVSCIPFNVKHDNKSFAVGSGSSKQRYYFKHGEQV